jgi:hypothetical protein
LTPDDARRVLLEIITGMSASGTRAFGRHDAMEHAARRLGAHHDERQHKMILDAWDDLYRSGIVSWGTDLVSSMNSASNWAHLTQLGVDAVKNLSRDPSNPAGYRNTIDEYVRDLPVVVSYLNEAIDTFNRASIKASAVMLGAAAESMNLTLRDKLKAKIAAAGRAPPKALDDFRIATVLRAVEGELEARTKDMPNELRERFESYWPAWTGLFRMTRNEAGHPRSVEPVTRDAVHAALLLFHEQARLSRDLLLWVDQKF